MMTDKLKHTGGQYSRRSLALTALLLAAALLLVGAWQRSEYTHRTTAPCSEFASWKVTDLPVRCFDDYGIIAFAE